jgi:hypothetical protein
MADNDRELRLAELAYQLAMRTLEHQDQMLDQLRARTGTLLAAASVVASFLGATAIDRAGIGPFGVAALVAFVSSIGASVYVLLPKESLIFSLSGTVFIEQTLAEDIDLTETYRRLAYWVEGYSAGNAATVARLFAWYRIAVLALLAEVCLWAAQLGGTL